MYKMLGPGWKDSPTQCVMFTGALHLELEIEEKHTFELQTRSSSDEINTLACKFKESTFPHFFSVYMLPYVC